MIPTALTQSEAIALTCLAAGRRVLEAGSLFGYSTLRLAELAKSVLSVDLHKDYPGPGASTWEPFLDNMSKYGGFPKVKPLRKDFRDVSFAGFDFAFADLTGEYDLTLEFLHKARDIPLVAIHDFERNNCEGVAEAIRVSRRSPILRVDTLIVLERWERE